MLYESGFVLGTGSCCSPDKGMQPPRCVMTDFQEQLHPFSVSTWSLHISITSHVFMYKQWSLQADLGLGGLFILSLQFSVVLTLQLHLVLEVSLHPAPAFALHGLGGP